MIKDIIKRDGKIEPFDVSKIKNAIYKAAVASGGDDKERAEELAYIVAAKLARIYNNESPSIEDIQDMVEKVLIENGHAKTAKAYILYRERRTKIRETKSLISATVEMFTDYLADKDWNIKESICKDVN